MTCKNGPKDTPCPVGHQVTHRMAGTGGDAMTLLTSLLCLGLTVGAGTSVQAGTLSKPTLWAEQGSVIPWGRPVTLWCQGSLGAEEFRLDKEGSPSSPWARQSPLEPGNKTKFSISYMAEQNAGTYRCYYVFSTGWSAHSDPLELVVTGASSKPSLSALQSLVVPLGGNVTLRCSSDQAFDRFVLRQEGEPETLQILNSTTHPDWQHQALFSVGPMTLGCSWTFRCYGYYRNNTQVWSKPSDPLQLLVSDALERPSLLSPQGLIVTRGQILTLQCHSEDGYDQFALVKEGAQDLLQSPGQQPQPGFSQADFLLGPINSSHKGQYRCYGGHDFFCLWSEASDPMDILVAGEYNYTPTLSVQPGPTVSPGENVTLQCRSGGYGDIFFLAKEGTHEPPMRVQADNRDQITQARFSFHPVTSAHGGTYRCYSSHSITPYLLSHPSAPLQLQVSASQRDYTVENLLRLGAACFLLLVLGILLLEAWHSLRRL